MSESAADAGVVDYEDVSEIDLETEVLRLRERLDELESRLDDVESDMPNPCEGTRFNGRWRR